MDYKEFSNKTRTPRKKGKISNSWGVYDAYKHIMKNKWYNIGRPVKSEEFYAIVRGINKLLGEGLAMGKAIAFPHRMGIVELRKFKGGVSIKNGKLKISYPVNWDATLKLWFKDEEAREKKILIRHESEYLYHFKYLTYPASFNNKRMYGFEVNRWIKLALKDNIKNGKVDVPW